MKISKEDLKQRYRTLTNEELCDIYYEGQLTDVAKILMKEEMVKRGLSDERRQATLGKRIEKSDRQEIFGSLKDSFPTTRKMIPSLYLTILLTPVLFTFAMNSNTPRVLTFVMGYLPIVGVFLFVNKAWKILEDDFGISKPKFIPLLLLPIVNVFSQYWSVLHLGKSIKKAIFNAELDDLRFNGSISEFYCYLYAFLVISTQVRIHFQVTYEKVPFEVFMFELITTGVWIFVTGSMLWDYSRIINNLLDRQTSDN